MAASFAATLASTLAVIADLVHGVLHGSGGVSNGSDRASTFEGLPVGSGSSRRSVTRASIVTWFDPVVILAKESVSSVGTRSDIVRAKASRTTCGCALSP